MPAGGPSVHAEPTPPSPPSGSSSTPVPGPGPAPAAAAAAASAPATTSAPDAFPEGDSAPAGTPAAGAAATGPAAASRRAGLLLTLVLGGLTALPPLSTDMYLPALPAVTRALGAPAATVQITLTACLIGMALGQIVIGPMSDKWGRRRPLLVGMSVYVVASIVCAFAPNAEVLIAVRLVQGLAGAAGIVISRAVVRDLFDGIAMARFFSSLMLVSGVAPIVAPVFGGQMLRVTDWRGIFVVITVVGALLTLVAARWLHETLPPEKRHGGGVGTALRTMRGLLGDRAFSGYLLTGTLAFTALFAYVSASPFVMQVIYGASPQTYSVLFGINAVGSVGIGQLNGRVLVGRFSMHRILGCGLVLITGAAAALLLMTTGALGHVGMYAVATGLFALMMGMGLVNANANTLGLMRAGHAAGSASALLGTSSFLVGSLASPLVGVAGEHTAVPMALVQLVCCREPVAG
ncbi:multidrug effflux MFS transporter [Streptomyces fuscigenes]|uniref:multidrug effflux MFS transporter n=1 Tax=Streptomyces fuscigenes TaxID=1528880 RepID=UPI001F1737CE|nr:multidrug effflux MFS transporter [Streptomyces fuscigenes]MCF3964015.1 multidrug effflux MFS transporter [Streptomyces fuscigenes]